MGTNFYMVLEKDVCKCCGRSDQHRIHLGKKSGGWRFSFQGYPQGMYSDSWPSDGPVPVDLTTRQEWIQFLKMRFWNGWDIRIEDEYREPISIEEFVATTDAQYADGKVHNEYCRNNPTWAREYSNRMRHWDDPEGYSFSIVEFS